MKLKNKNGLERNFRILFELENKDKKYVIYEDINTLNVYGGRKINSDLLPLSDSEFNLIENLLKKINE